VIVFYEYRVEQTEAVIRTSAATNRVFLENAVTGRGFPRIQNPCRRPRLAHGGNKTGRLGRNSGEPPDKI